MSSSKTSYKPVLTGRPGQEWLELKSQFMLHGHKVLTSPSYIRKLPILSGLQCLYTIQKSMIYRIDHKPLTEGTTKRMQTVIVLNSDTIDFKRTTKQTNHIDYDI
jgi:hypothetical protein